MTDLSSNRRTAGVVISVLAGLFLAALDQTIVSTALPVIVARLHGFNAYTWILAAYLIPLAAGAPVSAHLSRQFGRRRIFLACVGIFCYGSLLAGWSIDLGGLIFARAIQGLGASGLVTGAFAVIASTFEPRERMKWNALAGSIFSLASLAGPLVGGVITDHLSWPWIFFLNIPAGLIVALLAVVFLHNSVAPVRGPVDWLGAVLSAACTAPLILALLWAGVKYPWQSPQILGLLALSLCLGVGFIFVEQRTSSPVLSLKLFRNRTFVLICIIITLTSGVFFGAVLYIPIFLQIAGGKTATNSGWLLLPLVAGVFVGSVIAGRLVSRTGKYFRIGLISLLITVFAVQQLSTISHSTGASQLVIDMVVLGLGLGPGMSLFQTIAQNLFEPQFTGSVVGATGFFRTIGGALGAAILGSVFYHHLEASLHSIPSGAIPSPSFLLDALHDPNVLTSGQIPADVTSQLQPNELAALQPAIGQYFLFARESLADVIGHVFSASVILSTISLVLYVAVEERELRSSKH
jgi:EmrB/QacA subfamily drug resistance transporter